MSSGYPSEWERPAYTRDGVAYRIRPIRTEDAAHEREFIMGLSSESRYMRMMYTMCEPSPDLVARFVHVDYRLNMAFVAIDGRGDDERIVGVARYAADTDGELEFAIVVTDAWQGRGVGATLTSLLFNYARAGDPETLRPHSRYQSTYARVRAMAWNERPQRSARSHCP
jgi:acetyltransferase